MYAPPESMCCHNFSGKKLIPIWHIYLHIVFLYTFIFYIHISCSGEDIV